MSKIDTNVIRKEWADEPDSELKRASLKLCDDYEEALKSIIVNKRQAEQLLMGKPVHIKKVVRYGDTQNHSKEI